MRLLAFSFFLTLAGVVPADAADSLRDQAKDLFQPIPASPPVLPGNPASAEKLKLGRMLYFEPRLSEAHNISCNSCHLVGLAGADGRPNSIGHNWQRGGRNAPTVFNAVFNTAQFWDGRAADLKEQAGGPIANPIEMGITKEHAVNQLKGIPGYLEAFKAAYPDAADPVTYGNIEGAIAVFEATLITPDAPFDRWLTGDDGALDEQQRQGLAVFIEKGCASCHNGINVGGGMYAPFGVVEKPGWEFLPPDDHGRLQVTKTVEDDYVFKVPTLRNIALTAPYFHSGHAWDLKQAVAIMGTAQLGEQLTPGEIDQVTAFLNSLTGRQPEIPFPVLPPSVASTPRPQP
ncbi:cytochrome c peroxidase [Tistlia consotensis]|uniref:Cytochrome c peroxidase n=1 Tax=Tistlia consotensis USBA 355 TaxID=560819 RepID=A0A1Y6BEL5_9PROT|nr:cytochrome-c peroxidase [Tistlia consotensis]SME97549.1 cytochrome c peroxidase [Tistlia consotensis USBA 355]SNR56881.1 cytochrome c peroxidase [Tistlia consotensis]